MGSIWSSIADRCNSKRRAAKEAVHELLRLEGFRQTVERLRITHGELSDLVNESCDWIEVFKCLCVKEIDIVNPEIRVARELEAFVQSIHSLFTYTRLSASGEYFLFIRAEGNERQVIVQKLEDQERSYSRENYRISVLREIREGISSKSGAPVLIKASWNGHRNSTEGKVRVEIETVPERLALRETIGNALSPETQSTQPTHQTAAQTRAANVQKAKNINKQLDEMQERYMTISHIAEQLRRSDKDSEETILQKCYAVSDLYDLEEDVRIIHDKVAVIAATLNPVIGEVLSVGYPPVMMPSVSASPIWLFIDLFWKSEPSQILSDNDQCLYCRVKPGSPRVELHLMTNKSVLMERLRKELIKWFVHVHPENMNRNELAALHQCLREIDIAANLQSMIINATMDPVLHETLSMPLLWLDDTDIPLSDCVSILRAIARQMVARKPVQQIDEDQQIEENQQNVQHRSVDTILTEVMKSDPSIRDKFVLLWKMEKMQADHNNVLITIGQNRNACRYKVKYFHPPRLADFVEQPTFEDLGGTV